MAVVTIDNELQADFEAVAAPDEKFEAFIAEAAREALARRQRELAARAEAQAILNGPRRSLAESSAAFQLKYNIPDLSHLTHEQLIEEGEAILASLPPDKIAEAERLGLI